MQQIQAVRVELSSVEEAPWNVNVVPPDKFAQLKKDMKEAGPERTDPIDTCFLEPPGEKYTCDGAHRLRAARELGWKYLYEIFHPEITTEEDARLFNYKRDADRGDIDPFKLAASFKWFVDRGLKQDQVAAKFGVAPSTVSSRLSLLRVDEEVKKQVVTNTRFSVSHLEPIAALPAQLQAKVLEKVQGSWEYDDLQVDQKVSVKDVEQAVQQVKAEDRKQRELDALITRSKVKVCPKCGKKPRASGYKDYGKDRTVECESGNWQHTWDVDTGETEAQRMAKNRAAPTRHAKPKVIPHNFVSSLGKEEVAGAIGKWIFSTLAQLKDVSDIDVTGHTKDGKPVSFYFRGSYFHQKASKGSEMAFHFEKAKDQDGTFVEFGEYSVRSKKEFEKLQGAFNQFMETNQNFPRGKSSGKAK